MAMATSCRLIAGVSALALGVALLPIGANGRTIYYPVRNGIRPTAQGQVGPWEKPYKAPGSAGSGTWTDLTASLPFTNGPAVQILLTDGTVLVDDFCTPHWYKLTPDKKGRYENGSWSSIAAMPSPYRPMYFASEILADGRLIIDGGEYNGDLSNNCLPGIKGGALYDPVSDSWTAASPPSSWGPVDDAPSVILPDGSYMLANCCTKQQAIASIDGTTVTWTNTGAGKADINLEEGWTQLPGGGVLTVDVTFNHGTNPNQVEIYNPGSGTWSVAGQTAQQLVNNGNDEIGPGVMRPDGNLIYFGAVGHNDIYHTSDGTWTAGPGFPQLHGQQYDCADAPAVLLPNGKVLVQASPGLFNPPSHFWEFTIDKAHANGTLVRVDDPAQAGNTTSAVSVFLDLPTGQVLWNDGQTLPAEVATYTPRGGPEEAWRPVVSSVSNSLKAGSSNNAVSGTNFNGFSQGAMYGDDAQMSTNWPIVRLRNAKTHDVCYARSHDFSTMGVWTTGTTNAAFDIPRSCEKGASSLQVVVNGVASPDVPVTLN
jgi:hypothetical protein